MAQPAFPDTAARPYRVEIADLYDPDVRDVIRLAAYGPEDVRQQVRTYHPGYYVRAVEAICLECDPHAIHSLACPRHWSGEDFVQRCPCTTYAGKGTPASQPRSERSQVEDLLSATTSGAGTSPDPALD